MTELEYDILDRLYFVTSFDALMKESNVLVQDLKHILNEMISKGWVNYYTQLDGEMNEGIETGIPEIEKLFFLASKKGLLIHNSR